MLLATAVLTPEPSTMWLVGGATAAAILYLRKKRK
ncbi:MAG: PEP-CTERM sorting domain-containing protein [Bryobacteraceae bacterium]|nr:PEP-CTERM sorting domain-containing protein [Bryobacteraceae bacterium]